MGTCRTDRRCYMDYIKCMTWRIRSLNFLQIFCLELVGQGSCTPLLHVCAIITPDTVMNGLRYALALAALRGCGPRTVDPTILVPSNGNVESGSRSSMFLASRLLLGNRTNIASPVGLSSTHQMPHQSSWD